MTLVLFYVTKNNRHILGDQLRMRAKFKRLFKKNYYYFGIHKNDFEKKTIP